MMCRITLLLLCCVGLGSCVAASRDLAPTVHGDTFHASVVPDTIFLPSDLVPPEEYPHTATLLAQVYDVHAKPVEGVPVTLQFAGSQCEGVVTLSAQRAVTLQRRASVTLSTADTTGACKIAVRVDTVTQEVWVTVSSPPDPFDRR